MDYEDDDASAVAALEIALTEEEEGEILDDTPAPSTNNSEKLQAKWVTQASHQSIGLAIGGKTGLVCQLCHSVPTSRKRRRLHVRLEYVPTFFPCGYKPKWRETVRMHQKDECNTCDPKGIIYEVNSPSFTRWQRTNGTNLPAYPGEIPTRILAPTTATASPKKKKEPSASTVASQPKELKVKISTHQDGREVRDHQEAKPSSHRGRETRDGNRKRTPPASSCTRREPWTCQTSSKHH